MSNELIKTNGEYKMEFAKATKQMLRNLEKDSGYTTAFTKYTQDEIIGYLQYPTRYQSKLIEASNYFYNNSAHYRRLIMYYAQLPTYDYYLSPFKFDKTKLNTNNFEKQYYKVCAEVEKMNLKHEMVRAMTIALRDGAAYGVVWENNDTWYVQYLNYTNCRLSSIENGTYLYAYDFSKIKEEELDRYPAEFTTLWNEYQRDGIKMKEIPSNISFCLKADEANTNFTIPPFISTVPSLYTIEDAKDLAMTAAEQNVYKLLNMEIPRDKDGNPSIEWDLAMQYWQQVKNAIPNYIGLSVTPMPMKEIEFKDSGVQDVDDVANAERTFWQDAGVSALLFGDGANDTAGALKLSIKADEAVSFALLTQAERLVNRFVTTIAGTAKFKVNFLRTTIFDNTDYISTLKELATLGVPVKSALCASSGMQPSEIAGMAFVENEIIKCQDIFVPLSSSYNTPADEQEGESGRPQSDDTDLSESGEATRDTDANENR